MPDKTGVTIAVALAGGILVWSGVFNKGALASARDLLQGNKPAPGSTQSFSVNLGTFGSSNPATGSIAQPALGNASVQAAQNNARLQAAGYGWVGTEFQDLVTLWDGESGWRWDATNPSSGAYGIPQALPGSKMASAGSDWKTNATTQIKWGLQYIHDTYGSPSKALAAWESRSPHWY